MVKRIKFSLKMANGEQVRNIDDLRENFDLSSVMGYFADGKLLTWLEDRYYDEEIEAVKSLTKDDRDLGQKLCKIFDVKYDASMVKKIDVGSVERRNQKMSELKQYTTDTEILEKIDNVAVTQKEFVELLGKKLPEIFLLNNTYTVPPDLANVTLTGVGEVILKVNSNRYIDFENKNVVFKNLKFDDKYWAIAKPEKAKELVIRGRKLYKSKEYEEAVKLLEEASSLGSGNAYADLSDCYYYGNGVEKNYKKSFEYAEKAAEYSIGSAFYRLGELYLNGQYVNQDGFRAKEFYEKAIKVGNNDGYFGLGVLYSKGCSGVETDGSLAVEYFEKAKEHGINMATYWLGEIFASGEIIPKDIGKAIDYYLDAGSHGIPDAYADIGFIYLAGDTVSQDIDKCIQYFTKSGDEGYPLAYIYIGHIYMDYDIGILDREVAKKWYRKAADQGLAEGFHYVAYTIFATEEDNGFNLSFGTDSDNIDEAIKWYEKAANMDFAKSCRQLANIYSSKYYSPLKNDMNESWVIAEKWYSKGLELGDKDCAYWYASRYESGSSIDIDKAISIYTKGAELGDVSCMHSLAEIYYEGRGSVAQDLNKAEKWASRAVEKEPGVPAYRNLLEEIQKANGTYQEKIVIDGSPSSSNCFITTAVCGSLNKPDDCDELMTMRWYRDKLKAEDPVMADLIKEYYRVAPLVVKKIDETSEAPMVYRQLWDNSVSKIYQDIKAKEYYQAKLQYMSMLEELCMRYNEPLAPGIDAKIKKVRLNKN